MQTEIQPVTALTLHIYCHLITETVLVTVYTLPSLGSNYGKTISLLMLTVNCLMCQLQNYTLNGLSNETCLLSDMV